MGLDLPVLSRDPRTGPDAPRLPDGADVRRFSLGDVVEILARPGPRRVVDVVWHSMRHEYVYVVETQSGFAAYWFFEQLRLVEVGGAPERFTGRI